MIGASLASVVAGDVRTPEFAPVSRGFGGTQRRKVGRHRPAARTNGGKLDAKGRVLIGLRAAVAALLLLGAAAGTAEADSCEGSGGTWYWTTGYVRTAHGTHTADGTPILTDEPIVAASYDLPLGAYVYVDGLGTFRVADRGIPPAERWLDVATWTYAEAYQLTGWYCTWRLS